LRTQSNGNQVGKSKNAFSVAILNNPIDFGEKRWTVDTPEDHQFAQQLMGMIKNIDSYTWLDLLQVVQDHPAIEDINADVRHKSMKEVDQRAKK
jgi:spore coat polysaccharide biosynthesis protein SpsF (cytidylyltransferase family)